MLILDEPTTALDVTIQAQVLEALATVRASTSAAQLLITHDLGVIAGQADRVAVLDAGRVVEMAAVGDLFASPAMPYTLGLLGGVPRLTGSSRTRLTPIPGTPPSLLRTGGGCPFAPRCPAAQDICAETEPPLREVAAGHLAACHFTDQVRGLSPRPCSRRSAWSARSAWRGCPPTEHPRPPTGHLRPPERLPLPKGHGFRSLRRGTW